MYRLQRARTRRVLAEALQNGLQGSCAACRSAPHCCAVLGLPSHAPQHKANQMSHKANQMSITQSVAATQSPCGIQHTPCCCRFRERQKEKAQDAERRMQEMTAELSRLKIEKVALEERNKLLEKVLSFKQQGQAQPRQGAAKGQLVSFWKAQRCMRGHSG